MKIYLERDDKEKNIRFNGTVKELLDKLNIILEDVIVSCNGEIVDHDYVLRDTDEVKILSVISGG